MTAKRAETQAEAEAEAETESVSVSLAESESVLEPEPEPLLPEMSGWHVAAISGKMTSVESAPRELKHNKKKTSSSGRGEAEGRRSRRQQRRRQQAKRQQSKARHAIVSLPLSSPFSSPLLLASFSPSLLPLSPPAQLTAIEQKKPQKRIKKEVQKSSASWQRSAWHTPFLSPLHPSSAFTLLFCLSPSPLPCTPSPPPPACHIKVSFAVTLSFFLDFPLPRPPLPPLLAIKVNLEPFYQCIPFHPIPLPSSLSSLALYWFHKSQQTRNLWVARFSCVLCAICARFWTRCLAVISDNLLAPLARHSTALGGVAATRAWIVMKKLTLIIGTVGQLQLLATPPRCLLLLLHFTGRKWKLHAWNLCAATGDDDGANETAALRGFLGECYTPSRASPCVLQSLADLGTAWKLREIAEIMKRLAT